jgi:hypothetical protein
MKRNEGEFNLVQLEAVALSLNELIDEVTFVGGMSQHCSSHT